MRRRLSSLVSGKPVDSGNDRPTTTKTTTKRNLKKSEMDLQGKPEQMNEFTVSGDVHLVWLQTLREANNHGDRVLRKDNGERTETIQQPCCMRVQSVFGYVDQPSASTERERMREREREGERER